MSAVDSVEACLEKHIPPEELAELKGILFGYNAGKPVEQGPVPEAVQKAADAGDFQVMQCSMSARAESKREPNIVKIGLIQNAMPEKDTTKPVKEQYLAIEKRTEELIDAAAGMGANVLCLQEAWTMPFAFCTREKYPWVEFAEDAETGDSTKFIMRKAKQHNMVIVSPILERDEAHGGILANTAVIIGNNGNYIGKSRKNHIPRVGDFNESTYYAEGNTGHPVFETAFGRIGVNICYGRHHYLNWMGYGLNGAQIVFNPSATVGALSEPMWGIEARNAAIQNNYFVGAINRVGTESFPNEFTSADGKPAHKDFGAFYGSSYLAGPDSSRTPGLSRHRDGVHVTEVDLNLAQQVKDIWTLQMTARYPLYQDLLTRFIRPDFERQIIRDPSLDRGASAQRAASQQHSEKANSV